jgi:hypothetical protein
MDQAEAMIAEEEAFQKEAKRTIRVEEEIISNNKNGDFRSSFLFKAKAD